MNKTVTSQQEILSASRKLLMEKGIASLGMRAVAAECGVAVGSIYNYFPSKSELLGATVESVWQEILKPFNEAEAFDSFAACAACLFETIKNGDQRYPGFFGVHSLNFVSEERAKGRARMDRYFDTLKEKLAQALENDPNVREGVFRDGLSAERYIGYVVTLLMSALLEKDADCGPLLRLIKNSIY